MTTSTPRAPAAELPAQPRLRRRNCATGPAADPPRLVVLAQAEAAATARLDELGAWSLGAGSVANLAKVLRAAECDLGDALPSSPRGAARCRGTQPRARTRQSCVRMNAAHPSLSIPCVHAQGMVIDAMPNRPRPDTTPSALGITAKPGWTMTGVTTSTPRAPAAELPAQPRLRRRNCATGPAVDPPRLVVLALAAKVPRLGDAPSDSAEMGS